MALSSLIRSSYLELHNVKETKMKSSVNKMLLCIEELLLELLAVRIE
jgi:hypothetical protein